MEPPRGDRSDEKKETLEVRHPKYGVHCYLYSIRECLRLILCTRISNSSNFGFKGPRNTGRSTIPYKGCSKLRSRIDADKKLMPAKELQVSHLDANLMERNLYVGN
jgi:hypothetical protein